MTVEYVYMALTTQLSALLMHLTSQNPEEEMTLFHFLNLKKKQQGHREFK